MTQLSDQTNYQGSPSAAGGVEAVARRLAGVRERMNSAAARAGRDPGEILLVAVSKAHPPEVLQAAIVTGQRHFGENRVQEAIPKLQAFGEKQIHWHLIGHLQRNKVNAVVGRFELIHSVDSVRLLEALEQRAAALDLTQRILFQINVAGEQSKFGVPPEELPGLLKALSHTPHLKAEGLMTIPPYSEDPQASRPYYQNLRRMLATAPAVENFQPRHLSMGMSGDFEVAIEEGATIIRVGTAIFGSRG